MTEDRADEIISLFQEALLNSDREEGAELVALVGFRDPVDEIGEEVRSPEERVREALSSFRAAYLDPVFIENDVARHFYDQDFTPVIEPAADRYLEESRMDLGQVQFQQRDLHRLQRLWEHMEELVADEVG